MDFDQPPDVITQARNFLSGSKPAMALRLLRRACKTYPSEFDISFMYAQLLGDLSFSKSRATGLRMRNEAITVLRKLSRVRNRSADERWKVLRHLYYFSGQHLKNYRLGLAEVSRGNRLCFLSQGIGAGCHALSLLEQRNTKQAMLWAEKAERAWLSLFQTEARQPNRLCHFARALAIQGKYADADECVREAAQTARAPMSSFRAVRNELTRIKRIRRK